ncbi:5-methylaminomethyl-2-thiouridylate-methyltransferase [Thamnocephalis sphaerospora]|uniref:tRNA-5-taurinomethyluridine 2-sulfurtransferase n=1 Tax=Thamnocephalis sphaerospora TaxID=78915 RepID=A0A4P9XRU8_9FUNG|nr:5-methylaminomethyl-2-thiouridylate-methyltransferase [Thamnocephalis sphaerospora]|eukprot:RKP08060.1 5-methylaminomethyl-2-thiouridylate-methyltransferase [Thamnocephalis sphaerospora]
MSALRVRGLSAVAGRKIILGMSGGVDSSVAAYLLKQQGAQLEGVFMRNWDAANERGECPGDQDWRDVQAVDFVREYWTRVFAKTIDDYANGHTPNPDIACNREIKFGALVDRCVQGDAWLATGHYARIACDAGDVPYLLRGVDSNKDQSYYLSDVKQSQLARAIFPLGSMDKSEVRAIARAHKLTTANKAESMGICFVGKRPEYIPQHPGEVVSLGGRVLGQHQGIFSWTVGQRAGICAGSEKWFVVGKDIPNNKIYVVPGTTHPALFATKVTVANWHWIGDRRPEAVANGRLVSAQIRYRQQPDTCRVAFDSNDGDSTVHFVRPQRAPAPGQYIVLYDGDCCLGCGVIQTSPLGVASLG